MSWRGRITKQVMVLLCKRVSRRIGRRLHPHLFRHTFAVSRAPIWSLPSEDAALVLRFCRVASGQVKLRRIDGWRKIAGMTSEHRPASA